MTKKFNPLFEDKEFNEAILKEVQKIKLVFPDLIDRSEDFSFWTSYKVVFDEEFQLDMNTHETVEYFIRDPKILTLILRQNYEYLDNFTVKDVVTGERTDRPMPKELYDILFPPRVWMSDNINESIHMYNAAKNAKGNVLVGGLGLGIYPQYIFALNRPVDSITIVDSDKDIVDIIGKLMLDSFPDRKINIVHDSIENFMQNTSEKFDTVHFDTWGDLNFKFLFYINYLISLADKITTENGSILAWGYKHMYEDFLASCKLIRDKPDTWERFYLQDNEVMMKFIEKLKKEEKLTEKEYEEYANDMILNTVDPKQIPLTMSFSSSNAINQRINF